MRVILRQDVDSLGQRGEAVEVRDGYARNFLLPRGMAYMASADNEKRIAKEQRHAEAQAEARAAQSRDLAAKLAGLSATVQVKADGETIYGSVGADEIIAAIASEHGLQVASDAVRLEEPIKKIGTHDVLLRLGEGAEATVKVWVLPEDGAAPKDSPGSDTAG
jgi:large subunit ribosomal protein L9